MSAEIACCPFCRSKNADLIQLERLEWAVVCNDCRASGPVRLTPWQARDSWSESVSFSADQIEQLVQDKYLKQEIESGDG